MGQLAIIDVDGADEQFRGLGILNGQVTESAKARDSDPFARLRRSLLDLLVSGDSSTDQWRGIRSRNDARHMRKVIRVGEDVLCKTPVPGVAAELRQSAHRLPAFQAVLAVPTRRRQPGHPDPVALLYNGHARSYGGDQTDAFMARNERECGPHRPVAMGRVKVGVADAAGFGVDQNLAWLGRGDVPFQKRQRFSELLDNCGVHLERHG
jgi:hypothetical protein